MQTQNTVEAGEQRKGHTPGEWKVNKEASSSVHSLESHSIYSAEGSRDYFLADVYGRTNQERAANARLIAASPRMKEGLITIANIGSGEAKRIALQILREIDGATEGEGR